MRRTQHVMGTVASIDIPDCDKEITFDKVFERLKEIDEKFSPFKPSSEVSRFARGELTPAEASQELRAVIDACKRAEMASDGVFSAYYEGKFEPSGYVKGWAIAEAGKLIKRLGHSTFCVGIGGDVLAAGEIRVWKIGIQNPDDPGSIVATIDCRNFGIATSGTYERGRHIINPKTKKPADFWKSVTIADKDIIAADVAATVCYALAEQGLEYATAKNLDFLFVDKNDCQFMSEGFKELLA